MLALKDIKDFDLVIKTNQEMQTDSYIIWNRGYITASKLKDYMKSPEFYFRKYILEQTIDAPEKKCFKMGTAIDDLISYGKEKFDKKYFIDPGLLKWDLESLAIKKGIPLEAKETVVTLKEKIFNCSEKIRLTAWEGETVTKLMKEFSRQKLFDLDGGYEVQKTFYWTYQDLELKGTLDRFKIIKEENGTIYIIIRDTKTTGNIIKFRFQAVDELGYDTSMSFYNLLAILDLKREKKNPDLKVDTILTLDVCQTTGAYPSRFVKLPPELVEGKIDKTIKPALASLNAHMKIWNTKKDYNIWLVETPLEITKDLDLYGEMDTTIQQTWDWLD